MKTYRISFVSWFFLGVLFLTSCDLFRNKDDAPGIAIYKTRGDYFKLVTIGIKDNIIFRQSSYTLETSKFFITSTDTIYRNRVKLIDGYILDVEADEKYDVFLNLTFKDHMKLEAELNRTTLPEDTLRKHILDTNPYIEFYRDTESPRKFSNQIEKIDTSQLNQIIRQGNLQQYFTRLK